MFDQYVIRALRNEDNPEQLTELIHAAYAPQAAAGLRYWATHQSIEDTKKRFASGHGFVATSDHAYIGTITARPPQPDSPVELYRDPCTWSICQFAVAPLMKRRGVGRALHSAAVRFAMAQGARRLALDTATGAESLIRLYQDWGYTKVGLCDWRPHTNYVSVLMCLELHPLHPPDS